MDSFEFSHFFSKKWFFLFCDDIGLIIQYTVIPKKALCLLFNTIFTTRNEVKSLFFISYSKNLPYYLLGTSKWHLLKLFETTIIVTNKVTRAL